MCFIGVKQQVHWYNPVISRVITVIPPFIGVISLQLSSDFRPLKSEVILLHFKRLNWTHLVEPVRNVHQMHTKNAPYVGNIVAPHPAMCGKFTYILLIVMVQGR